MKKDKGIKCEICMDDGLCLNNEKNPNYESGLFGSDIYDCCDYLNVKEGKPKGSWMIDWMKRLKEKEAYESDFVKWSKSVKKILPILLLVFFSCDEVISSEPIDDEEPILEIFMNLPTSSDGLYLFDYPNNHPHTYTSVEYISSPMERVFWFSPDSFSVYHMWNWFVYPIINYSTYTSSDGTGKQLIYLYEPHIGDTLLVYGCIGDYCKEVSFIVTE